MTGGKNYFEMSDQKKELEVGDKVVSKQGRKIICIYTIERVTKTLAIAKGGRRFKREYWSRSGWIDVPKRGGTVWSMLTYRLATQSDFDELELQQAIKWVKEYASELDLDTAREVIKIMSKNNQDG